MFNCYNLLGYTCININIASGVKIYKLLSTNGKFGILHTIMAG